MSQLQKFYCALLLIAFVPGGAAWASDQITLQMFVEQEVTVDDENGDRKVTRVPPQLVTPGDEVIYRIVYTNVGDRPATDVVITNPVPEHMAYSDGSAAGTNTSVSFSVDDGRHFASPDELTVTGADGEERPASAADYTAIRWLITAPVPPGATGELTYRARVK